MSKQPKNFDLQAQISHPTEGACLIEASAGTGKTYTITNLFLRHILEGREVAQLLVVTFTKAATDELKGRIRQRLSQAKQALSTANTADDEFLHAWIERNGPDTEQLKHALSLAVRSMDEAAIYTIHSFCQKALGEFAFLSGQGYQFDIIDNDTQEHKLAALDWWRIHIANASDTLSRELFQQLKWHDFDTFYHSIHQPLQRQIAILPKGKPVIYLSNLKKVFCQLRDYWQQNEVMQNLLDSACYKKGKVLLRDKTIQQNKPLLDDWFESGNFEQLSAGLQSYSYVLLEKDLKKNKTTKDLRDKDFYKLVDQYITLLKDYRLVFEAQQYRSACDYIRNKAKKQREQKQQLSYQDLLDNLYQALQHQQGQELATAMAKKYPVAFIDEFQDTDPVQYGIFKAIYLQPRGLSLYLIGDPKQAIYSFRGGDINTYMQAKRDLIDFGGTLYTLQTNWRSTPEMIAAVNDLFQQKQNAFLYQDMPFYPAQAAPAKQKKAEYLVIEGKTQQALSVFLPEFDKELKVEDCRGLVARHVANQVAGLLIQAQKGQAFYGDRPLRASDIVILVPKHKHARKLQAALKSCGVDSMIASTEDVFHSEQAKALASLFRGIVHYRQHQAQRNALSSALLALGYNEMEAIMLDEQDWASWCQMLEQLHQKWQKQGFMAMFLQLMDVPLLKQGIKRRNNKHRDLTNLMHLAELLHQAAKVRNTMENLYQWFREQLDSPESNEREVRLESDEQLVQIVTLHKSKGLEYGVVFLPFMWDIFSSRSKNSKAVFHNKANELVMDCKNSKESKARADYERLAEHIRLAYVALTRSIAHCCLYWGNMHEASLQSLAWLLYDQPDEQHLLQQTFKCDQVAKKEATLERIKAISNAQWHWLEEEEPLFFHSEAEDGQVLQARELETLIDRHWQMSSFSRMVHSMEQGSRFQAEQEADGLHRLYPPGRRSGLLLHELLERTDFQQPLAKQLPGLMARTLNKYGFSEQDGAVLQHWLENIIHTPINQQGLKLADLSQNKRLNELDFHFSLKKIKLDNLNALIRKFYPKSALSIEPLSVKGMLTGIIDLVFEYQGRYYLLDYKSNFLGNHSEDYHYQALEEDIFRHHYHLQYLLYSVALHLYLKSRMADYQYQQHFGGVYYYYIRAVLPKKLPQPAGVYFDRPDQQVVEQLQAFFQ